MKKDLFSEVTEATGLPQTAVSGELERLLQDAGLAKTELTIEELRTVLANYVQDVLLASKEKVDQEASTEAHE